jgi:hypothetical protein
MPDPAAGDPTDAEPATAPAVEDKVLLNAMANNNSAPFEEKKAALLWSASWLAMRAMLANRVAKICETHVITHRKQQAKIV